MRKELAKNYNPAEFEDRLYFGTDIVGPWFTEELSSTLAQWLRDGVITKSAYNKITHENAMRLLGL
jgi:predicted TIM-barrel fold metal-dependent hydrolase